MRLTAVLSNPPQFGGERTLARVQMASELLHATELDVVNLFPLATRQSPDIADIGRTEAPWLRARRPIAAALDRSDLVLMAHGVSAPSGPARLHYRAQLAWVAHEIQSRSLPIVTVGGRPRHPSRWQRYTATKAIGNEAFKDTLQRSLQTLGSGSLPLGSAASPLGGENW